MDYKFVGMWSETYVKKLLFKLAMVFLIVGGINSLIVGIFDVQILGRVSFIIIGLSALAIMFDRDTYLPFLGPMVAPCSVLENRYPRDTNVDIKVVTEPNVKIIYWAAETSNLEKIKSWKNAYLDYQNAGVTTSNGEGVAILKIRDPQPYKVPIMGKLKPHVHYRICGEDGWMGRINTTYVKDKVEGFESNIKSYML
jgi:hypothetical protein